jgi:hypothetical protein
MSIAKSTSSFSRGIAGNGNLTKENKLPDVMHSELMISKLRRRRFEELTHIFNPLTVENQAYTYIRRSIKPSL